MTELAEDYLGTYQGTGRWRDTAGETRAYGVTLTLARDGDALSVKFTHVFHEEPDADDINFDVTLNAVAPSLLAFDLGPIKGRGYQDSDLVHYDIPLPGNHVEATYRFAPDGTCLVCGSSEKNAAGHHIMWVEDLRRG